MDKVSTARRRRTQRDYTIEATTYDAATTGDFVVSVSDVNFGDVIFKDSFEFN